MTTRTILLLASVLLLLPALAPAADEDEASGIRWRDYETGLAEAKESGKLVMIDFHADWCKYCKKMDKETFSHADVIARVEAAYVPVSVDTQRDKATAAKYGVKSLPTMWFLESDGKPITQLPGFLPAADFGKVLDFISTRSFESMSFQDFVEGDGAE